MTVVMIKKRVDDLFCHYRSSQFGVTCFRKKQWTDRVRGERKKKYDCYCHHKFLCSSAIWRLIVLPAARGINFCPLPHPLSFGADRTGPGPGGWKINVGWGPIYCTLLEVKFLMRILAKNAFCKWTRLYSFPIFPPFNSQLFSFSHKWGILFGAGIRLKNCVHILYSNCQYILMCLIRIIWKKNNLVYIIIHIFNEIFCFKQWN